MDEALKTLPQGVLWRCRYGFGSVDVIVPGHESHKSRNQTTGTVDVLAWWMLKCLT